MNERGRPPGRLSLRGFGRVFLTSLFHHLVYVFQIVSEIDSISGREVRGIAGYIFTQPDE